MEFLARPQAHGGAAVTRIDTHAASVFLAGDARLKVKRAVRFPFLDYSTLEKRKRACEAEIAVNRPYAPAIYRGRGGDHARARRSFRHRRRRRGGGMGGRHAPLRRDADARPSGRGRAHRRCARRRAGPRGGEGACGGAGRHDAGFRRRACRDHRAERRRARRRAGAVCARGGRRRSRRRRARLSRACGRLLDARERAGLVRRCHGDLHLGNIVLHRRRADAVRRHRVRSQARHRRRVLRSRLPAHGPDRARPAAGRQYRAQPLSQRDAARYGPRRAGRAAAVPVGAGGDPRQGRPPRAPSRASARAGRAKRARLFRAGRQADRAGAAAPAGGRRALRHRQVAAGARAGAAAGAGAGRGGAAQRCRAQGAVRPRRDRAPAAASLHARGHRRVYAALAAKARRVVAAGHSAIVDAVFATAQRARRHRAGRRRRRLPRPVPHRRSCHAACPRRRPHRRCLRRRRGHRPRPGTLRSRAARLEEDRRLRHAGGDLARAPRLRSALHERKEPCAARRAAPPPRPLGGRRQNHA